MSNNLELARSSANAAAAAVETIETPLRPVPGFAKTLSGTEANYACNTEWQRAFTVLRKNWRISGVFLVAVVVTTMIVTLAMKPIYEPEAKIELDPPGSEIFSLQGRPEGSAGAEYLETQSQKLQSDELAVQVIRGLHLERNPEFVGKLAASAESSAANFEGNNAPALTRAENAGLRSFRSKLKVKRDTSSRLVSIKFASHDSTLAATIVNTLISRYVENSYQTRHDAIAQSTQWLSRELDDIRQKMERSSQTLTQFQKTNGIADVGDNKSTVAEQMGELDRQLGQAQADRIQTESYLQQVRQAGPEALPQVRNNPVVQSLVQKLAEVHSELAQASVIYGNNHPNVRKLRNQADELEIQIGAQRNAIVSELRANAEAAKARESLLSRQIKEATKEINKVGEYNALKKEAQANTELYNSLYAKIKEAGISAASKSNNIRIVDRARVLDAPTRPRLLFNLAGALLVGLMGGVLMAFGRERLENRIHTVDDVRKVTGLTSIAMIPEFEGSLVNKRAFLTGIKPGQLRGASVRPAPAEKFLLSRPNSPEAEALRALYTSVMLSRPDNPPKALLIASSFQGEGKTTVAINLALALSQHSRTVLVDADLRRPGVASAFGLTDKNGLSDLVLRPVCLEEVLVSNPKLPNLFILPAGAASAPAAQLVCSEAMRAIIEHLRRQFEYVVIDSPPILAFSDGRALSPLVDGVILVGRSGSTTRQALVRSMELLKDVHSAPVLDIVLNAATDFNFAQYGY